MSFEQHRLKPVVYIIGRRVLVGCDFLKYHSLLLLHLPIRKQGLSRQFEEQIRSLAQILAQDRGMEDYLLLGGVGVQFPSQLFQIAVDFLSRMSGSPLEQSVFHKMGSPGRIMPSPRGCLQHIFDTRATIYAQGTVGRPLPFLQHSIAQPFGSSGTNHRSILSGLI